MDYKPHFMKTKIILFVLGIIAIYNTQAQTYHPFPDSNAIWVNAYKYYTTTYIYSYGLIGDTVIDLYQYNKLYRLHDSVLTINGAIYEGAIRESGKKVYYRDLACTHDIILYDFNKNANDTIFSVYSTFEINQCLDSTPIYIIISSIDSILINGSYRKVFHFEDDPAIWIEGIGSTVGLLTPIDPGVTGNYKWDLVCFILNDEVLYHNPNFGSCFKSYSGINDYSNTVNVEIEIFPNPIKDIINLDLSRNNEQLKIIHIYNVLGQLVYYREFAGEQRTQITDFKINPSIVYCRVETCSGKIFRKKLIIN